VTLHARPFSEDDDAQLLAHIVTRAALTAPQCPNWHVGDVWWGLYQNTVFNPHDNIRLWFDGAAPVGFAWLSPIGGVSILVVPERSDGAELEAEMLGWAEERRRTVPAGDGGHLTLTATAFAHDTRRIALLTQRGYDRIGTPMYQFHRPLSDPVVAAPLATNITIRQVGEVPEWEARVEMHREVWHPSKVTLDAYRRLRAVPGYRPEFDLVAVTAQGLVASYCICWLDPLTQTGEFEPVGTRSAFRRQGLGRAVISEGLRRLQEHGATQAIVHTPHTNRGARALYESVGFCIVGSEYDYVTRFEGTGSTTMPHA
jgi:mycothiol synthase